jgi:hypothetical protein
MSAGWVGSVITNELNAAIAIAQVPLEKVHGSAWAVHLSKYECLVT